MAERYEEDHLVPFEIGLQASETILMWGLGAFAWLVSLLLMGFIVSWNLTGFGIFAFVVGLLLVLASQIVSSYDPMKTTRFPVTGLLLWLLIVILSFFILSKGWSVMFSSGTDMLIFAIVYVSLAILATGGLLVSNFMTSVKVVNWMNMPMNSFLMTSGIASAVAGVIHIGFSNRNLMFIDEVSLGTWIMLFVFGISFLLFIELNTAAHRFNEIIHYAKKKAVGQFSLTPVINNYYIMGFILMLIVMVGVIVLMVINFFFRWVTPIFNKHLANSIMLNSVYSLYFTSLLLLVPLIIAMVLFFSYRSRKEKEEEEDLRRTAEKSQGTVY
ncbi:MAG: hypothetical protein QCI82_04915 [Candidatus Thermoplasmatota archaeon]|nr:hypothetical protein [Candidatus Thermoplasmatota archaeon]